MVRARGRPSRAHHRNDLLACAYRVHGRSHGYFDSAAHGTGHVSASQAQHPSPARRIQSRANRADLAKGRAFAKNFGIAGSADRKQIEQSAGEPEKVLTPWSQIVWL